VSPEESSALQVSTASEPGTGNDDGAILTKDMLEALEESVK
jgi:hypothetical protein